jgi:hypothetical protein
MMYGWAVNKQKLNRAIIQSVSKSDAEVKGLYIALGGKVDLTYKDMEEEKIVGEEEIVDAVLEKKEETVVPEEVVKTEAPEETVVTTDDTAL